MSDLKLEKPKWKLAAVVVSLALALAYLVFSDNGLLHVRQLSIGKMQIEKRSFDLEQTKLSLQEEIKRLDTNTEAQEQIIRQQMGMIREDETVFVFPEERRGEP